MKIKCFKIKNSPAVFPLTPCQYQLSHLAVSHHLWGSFLSTARTYYHSLGKMFWKKGILSSIGIKGLQVLLFFIFSLFILWIPGKNRLFWPSPTGLSVEFPVLKSSVFRTLNIARSLILGHLREQRLNGSLCICGAVTPRLRAWLLGPPVLKRVRLWYEPLFHFLLRNLNRLLVSATRWIILCDWSKLHFLKSIV